MIKVFALLPKRPDISDEEFHSHWRSPHGELVKRIRTIRRYVQSHRLSEGDPHLPRAPYHGVGEVWYDDLAAAQGLGEDRDYIEGAHADEPNIFDVSKLVFLFTEERVLEPGPPIEQDTPGAKLLQLIRHSSSNDVEAFHTELAAFGSERLARRLGARRHVLCLDLPANYGDADPPFDAIRELWWDSLDDFEAAHRASPDAFTALASTARGESFGILAEEYRVIWP